MFADHDTVPDSAIMDMVEDMHVRHFSCSPTALASAPATIVLAGAHTDSAGGRALITQLSARAWVSISKRDDDQVRIVARTPGGLFAGEAPLPASATHALSENAAPDSPSRPSDIPTTLADRLARQLAATTAECSPKAPGRRGEHGVSISIVSTIPQDWGLGDEMALDAALALALHAGDSELDEPPTRLAITAECMRAALNSGRPSGTARYAALLRGTTSPTVAIDMHTDAVFPSPGVEVLRCQLLGVGVPPGATADSAPAGSTTTAFHGFLSAAASAFGVGCLRDLPEVRTKVSDWLDALHAVSPNSGFPPAAAAQRWVQFFLDQVAHVEALRNDLRHRDIARVTAGIRDATWQACDIFPVSEQLPALLSLVDGAGAAAVLPATEALGPVVWALVPEAKATAIAKTLRDRGLDVLDSGLRVGHAARVEKMWGE